MPKIKITNDKIIANTIKPIVMGNLRYLKFIIEKNDVKISKKVLNSSTSSFLFSISVNP